MATGEHFAADTSVLQKSGGLELSDIDRGFMVVELTDEEVAALDVRPAKEGVGLELHGAFSFDDSPSLVMLRGSISKVGSVGGDCFFLDLEEEWIAGAVALHVDDVVAEADRAGANYFECDVDRTVLSEEVATLGEQAVRVGSKRANDALGRSPGDAGKNGVDGLEDARWTGGFRDGWLMRGRSGLLRSGGGVLSGLAGVLCWLGESEQVVDGSGALSHGEDFGHGVDVVETMHLIAGDFQHGHAGETEDAAAVAFEEDGCGFLTMSVLCTSFATGEDETGGHALHVPLEWANDGFVEVVDVKEEASFGAVERTEIADVGVATELVVDAGAG